MENSVTVKNALSFVENEAKPMTAATMITGTVFSLNFLVFQTSFVNLLRIHPKLLIIELAGGSLLDLFVSEICLIRILFGVFGISPNVEVLIIEIVKVFNFLFYVDIIVQIVELSYSIPS